MPDRPANGASYRLSTVERSVAELRGDITTLGQRFDRLDTHLTGEGIKGSAGVLGDVAEKLEQIARQLRHAEETRGAVITAEVQRQLAEAVVVRKAGYWSSLGRGTKWILGLAIGAATTAVVSGWLYFVFTSANSLHGK